MRYVTKVEDKTFVIEVQTDAVVVDGKAHVVDLRRIEPLSIYSLLVDNLSHEIHIEEQEGRHGALLHGKLYTAQVHEEHLLKQAACDSMPPPGRDTACIAAPMPGLVLEVRACVGQAARAGEVLVVLESMKMRTELRCAQDGVVRAVHVAPQDHVAHGQVLVTISP